jgi:hypothetical protein
MKLKILVVKERLGEDKPGLTLDYNHSMSQEVSAAETTKL